MAAHVEVLRGIEAEKSKSGVAARYLRAVAREVARSVAAGKKAEQLVTESREKFYAYWGPNVPFGA